MKYCIEIYDTSGRRVGAYDDVPLLEATRTAPDSPDCVRGLLPSEVTNLGHGYRVRVLVEGSVFCDAEVTNLSPQWGDTSRLILDKYVSFHKVVAFEAEEPADVANGTVKQAYANRAVGTIVKDAINSTLGSVHYLVEHGSYPDGSQREFAKFTARKTSGNELEVQGIGTGQWVGANRIDTSGAYAKDGDTIAGLVVDGQAWPDLRMMMIDCEETSWNNHAVSRHPEVADWSADEYDKSGYRLQGDAAKAALQDLLDTKGIEYIELNPHQDESGAFDDRIDYYGRYIGLVYGGGECFNASLVEQGLADVYLYNEGAYHVPEMELKDYFSYTGPNRDSVEDASAVLVSLDVTGGLFEVLTALAYAGGGYVWSLTPDHAVAFRSVSVPDRVVFFDPVQTDVVLGSDSSSVGNAVYFEGHPLNGAVNATFRRNVSIDEYGYHGKRLEYFSMSLEEDAETLVESVLDDLAYPEPTGSVTFFHGDSGIRVGHVVEVRGAAVKRLAPQVAGEWGGRFAGRMVARVKEVVHRFSGRQVKTTTQLTSPLRSVANPLSFIVRGQPAAANLYQFRLDDTDVGLDMGFHLD